MPHSLNLQHLSYFFHAARFSSVTASARHHHVGQSTVSQGIRRLEKDLQVRLLYHEQRQFHLTPEGEKLFGHASRVLREMEALKTGLKKPDHTLGGALRFATVNSIGSHIIPRSYRGLLDQHPHLDIHFKRGGLSFLKKSLLNRDVELVIALKCREMEDFRCHELHRASFQVFGPAGTSVLQLADGLLLESRCAPEYLQLCEACEHHWGFAPPIAYELSSWTLVERFAFEGLGLALLPAFMGEQAVEKGLFPLELPFSLQPYHLCAFYHQDEAPSAAALALESVLQTSLRSYSEQGVCP